MIRKCFGIFGRLCNNNCRFHSYSNDNEAYYSKEDFIHGDYISGLCQLKNNGECATYKQRGIVRHLTSANNDLYSLSWSDFFKRNIPELAKNITISYELEGE